MNKQKKIVITSLAIIGVMYGAATASASPFLTSLFHEIVALASPEKVATAGPLNNDVESYSEALNVFALMSDSSNDFVERDEDAYRSTYIASSSTHIASNGTADDSGLTGLQRALYVSDSGNVRSMGVQETILENVAEHVLPVSQNTLPIGRRNNPDSDDKPVTVAEHVSPVSGNTPPVDRHENPDGDKPGEKSDGKPGDDEKIIVAAAPLPVSDTVNASNHVPEPATLAMLGLGFAGLVASRRRRTY